MTPSRAARPSRARGPRVALVVKRSAWHVWIEERRDPRMTELVAHDDPTVARLRGAHEEHERTVRAVKDALAALGAEVLLVDDPSHAFDDDGRFDLVVTVGGDGTLLSASHSVGTTPVLGVNSAPNHSVGFFCAARGAEEASRAVAAALAGELPRTVLARMQVAVNGRVVAARVLNDVLFCHALPAATTRYLVRLGAVEEEQKSSGFWIGPAAGSTAAQRSAGGRVLPLGSRKLQLVVREPYTPHGERYALRRALVAPGEALVVRSKMHEGRLFVDGPHEVVPVGFGDVIELREAREPLTILGLPTRRRTVAATSTRAT